MPFEKGHKLSLGRPKGTKNKRTIEFQEVMDRKNFNVAEALVYCYRQAIKKYKYYNERLEDGRLSPMEDNAPKYLKIASDMAKDMASYSFPKLKSIDQTIANANDVGFKVIVEDYSTPSKDNAGN